MDSRGSRDVDCDRCHFSEFSQDEVGKLSERRVLQLREFIYFYLNSDVAEPPWRGSYDAERQDTVVCG